MIEPLDLPPRIVVGKNGAYWRDYGDHYSMVPVSTDNDPVEPIGPYYQLVRPEDWFPETEAAALAEVRADALDVTLREAAVQLRRAAVKAGAHIVVTNDYPDGVKAFGILCDAIDRMDAALEATEARAILAEKKPPNPEPFGILTENDE